MRRLHKALFAILLIPCFLSTSTIGFSANQDKPSTKIIVAVDGNEWEYTSSGNTVGGALAEAGVQLGDRDEISPRISARIANGMKVRVARVTSKIVTQHEPIKFKTVVRPTAGITTRSVVQKGVQGEKEVTYKVTQKDGREIGCTVVKYTITKAPVPEIVAVPRLVQLASRDGSYLRTLHMVATAYAPHACGGSRSGHAANGMRAGHGVVAVDPRVIRLGTRLFIDGYGYCVAGDVGGSIKGGRIDLGFDTYSAARRYGRHVVTVHILP